MTKLEFKAEQLIEPGFRNVKAEQIRAKRYRDRAQAIYDKWYEEFSSDTDKEYAEAAKKRGWGLHD